MKRKSIVIIGGGITGLTAAYYLQEKIIQAELPVDIQLLEQSNRLGGKIQTHQQDGFTIERGPDSFLARKQPAVRLVQSLGIEDELIRNQTGQAYILAHNELHPMPQGSFMGIPTELKPFLHTTLLSPQGKARVGLDYVLPRSNEVGDQSLGHFLRRRFGNELVDNIIEPLLSGIYAGDMDEMSLLATFPQFLDMEQEHRSLIKGLRETSKKRARQTGKKEGQFFSFKNGLTTLVKALESKIDPEIVRLDTSVKEIKQLGDRYIIQCQNEETITTDAVIVTTPHHTLPVMFSAYDFLQPMKEMRSNSVANVALAYDTNQINNGLDGTGFVISRNSDYHITACTWTHKKWQGTAPEGKALLRAYVGKPDDQAVVQLSDEEITSIALHDIERSMGITAKPVFSVVTRWEQAMPQYDIGHKARTLRIKRSLAEQLPGVYVAGSSFDGVGIPDCIGQAEQIIEQLDTFLKE